MSKSLAARLLLVSSTGHIQQFLKRPPYGKLRRVA